MKLVIIINVVIILMTDFPKISKNKKVQEELKSMQRSGIRMSVLQMFNTDKEGQGTWKLRN